MLEALLLVFRRKLYIHYDLPASTDGPFTQMEGSQARLSMASVALRFACPRKVTYRKPSALVCP
jgi:hypothetical protein